MPDLSDHFSQRTRRILLLALWAKLHLAHRTQAAVYAFKEGVVHPDEVEL